MPYFRALLVVFAAAVIVLAGLYIFGGDRRYLRWAGWLFGIGVAAAVLFFAVLLIQRFI